MKLIKCSKSTVYSTILYIRPFIKPLYAFQKQSDVRKQVFNVCVFRQNMNTLCVF